MELAGLGRVGLGVEFHRHDAQDPEWSEIGRQADRALVHRLAGDKPPKIILTEDDVAEVLICKRCDEHHPLVYFDNAIAACSDCGVRVQYRPEMPTDALTRFRCLICEVKHQGLG